MKRLTVLARIVIIGLALLVFYVLWCSSLANTLFTLKFNKTCDLSAYPNVLETKQLGKVELCMERQHSFYKHFSNGRKGEDNCNVLIIAFY